PISRNVDPKDRAIERCICVDVTTHVLNFPRDLTFPSRFRPLEKHVLENVRLPRSEMLVFVDASRGAPCLHAGYGGTTIFLDNNRQSVRQNPFVRGGRRKRNGGRGLRRSSFEIDHHK